MLLLEQQVSLGDDSEHAPGGVHHWHRTDPVLSEPSRDLLERRRRLGRHDLGRHYVAYEAAGHGVLLARLRDRSSATALWTRMAFARQTGTIALSIPSLDA